MCVCACVLSYNLYIPSLSHAGAQAIDTDNINVTRVSGTVIRVEWVPLTLVQARGFIQFYVVSYEPNSNRKRQGGGASTSGSVMVPGNQSTAVLDGLDPNLEYRITMAALNGAGTGIQSDPIISKGKYTLILATKVDVFLVCSISDAERFVSHV